MICYALKRVNHIALQYQDSREQSTAPYIWFDRMRQELAEDIKTAYVLGRKESPVNRGGESLAPTDAYAILNDVTAMTVFLQGFRNALIEQGKWLSKWDARARMYAGALRMSHSKGYSGHISLILPAHPGQASSCLTNCRCHWRIEKVQGDGNFNCYWERTALESCPECVNRAAQWNPFRIRSWMPADSAGIGTITHH